MSRPRILLLDGDYRASHYEPLREILDADWLQPPWKNREGKPVRWQDPGEVSPPWTEVDAVPADGVDLVLVTSEWPPHVGAAVAAYVREGVPVLHLADGILEWRGIWENPGMWNSAPHHQPVLSHKIACLGRAQARVLESWGNVSRCEVTGSPRFDALLGRQPLARAASEPFRFLVCTAQTPGFTEEQRSAQLASLIDVRQWFEKQDPGAAVPVWRLREGLDRILGVRNDLEHATLADALADVDAVVTTPSTVLLEAMLQRVPVALLDYTNSPQYVRAAWSVTSPDHVDAALSGMMEPDPARMLFQDTVLHDELECHSPAAPRVAELARVMIEEGRRSRELGGPLHLPPRIVGDPQRGHHLPEAAYDLDRLYPQRRTPEGDVAELRSEVLQLRHLLAIERRLRERWARWEIGHQLLVGLRAACERVWRRARARL